MRIFITGATGWIGAAVARSLVLAKHDVEGLARSNTAAETLADAGLAVRRGDLGDLDVLRAGAEAADAVLHLANRHDFSDMAGTNRTEHLAVATFVEALAGSDRPLAVASVLTGVAPGRVATELDSSPFHGEQSLRGGSENLALAAATQGVRSMAIRFAPTVHGPRDPGLLRTIVDIARASGESSFIDDGANRWPAVHVEDAAELVRAALEHAPAGTVLHAVAESGISTRDIATAIGSGLELPVTTIPSEQVAARFGWLGDFWSMDLRADSTTTRQLLGWRPTHPGVLDDLQTGIYLERRDT